MNLTQTIAKVENLINTGKGDPGRLYHLLGFLKNSKPLYNSDKTYLENMLSSSFSVVESTESPLLSKTQELINSGNGDLGRLQHIYEMLEKNKPLYNSDQAYLESKLLTLIKKPSVTKAQSPKKKREKTEQKIKVKNQKPKEQKPKKQIIKKDKKPKSPAKKPQTKKTRKKSVTKKPTKEKK